jgi:hypothetical protein
MEQSEKASHLDHVVTGCETQPKNLHVSQIQCTIRVNFLKEKYLKEKHAIYARSR